MTTDRALKTGEPHPSAILAQEFIATLTHTEWARWMDTFKRNMDDGDRQREAQICYTTMEKMYEELPVSDVEILGLAWAIKTGD